MIDRVARRGSVSTASLVDPHHEIESSRGRAIKVGQSIQPSLQLIVPLVIAHLVQLDVVSFQVNHLRGERSGLSMVVTRLGIWPDIALIVHLSPRLQDLNQLVQPQHQHLGAHPRL
nr:hypothetical protein [Solanum melongena]WMB96804.1 hypothetical protein [Solanum melongena]WMB97026.1 hypothetical protein [Solanum aethiopicum]